MKKTEYQLFPGPTETVFTSSGKDYEIMQISDALPELPPVLFTSSGPRHHDFICQDFTLLLYKDGIAKI